MNCQDFEQIWDEILDAGHLVPGRREPGIESSSPSSGEPDLPQSLRDHARVCADCQIRMRPFETLRRAIRSWEHAPRPAPSIDLADRILAAVSDENARLLPLRNRSSWKRGWIAGMAATAAAALAVALLPRNDRARPPLALPGPDRPMARIEPKPATTTTTPPRVDLLALNQAITDASDATWDLAYAASGPAVRIGHHVFDTTDRPTLAPGPGATSFPAGPPGEVVSDALSRFGEEISAGVRPLSDSALRAINFLQKAVPAPVPAIETPPPPSDSKGA